MSALKTLAEARKALQAEGAAIISAATEGGRIMLRIGIAIANADAIGTAFPKAFPKAHPDLLSWVQDKYDVTQPRIGVLMRAGRVALVIGTDSIDGRTSEDALAVFHKVLVDSKFELADASIEDRHKAVRRLWGKSNRNGWGTIGKCKAALAAEYPTLAEQGSRGPKAGTDAAKGNGRKPATRKPQTDRNTPTEGPKEIPDQAVSATRLRAAATRTNELFKSAGTAEAKAIMYTVAANLVETCERYGIGAAKASLVPHKPKAPRKPKAAPKAAPKRTPRKRTAKVS